jgi:arylsulfatase A-like enzyme
MPNYAGKDFIVPGAADEGNGPTEAETERIKALYFGEVTLVDRWVGHLLERIGRLNLWDDTIVMVLSDHGTQILDHGRFGKGPDRLHPYNTQLNWILHHPEICEARHVKGFVQAHDLLPTLMDLLDIPCGEVDGEDVWPLVADQRKAVRDHVVIGWSGFSNGPATGRASVRDDKWNYTVSLDDPQKQEELFDLEADPAENNNVIADAPEVVACQRARLQTVIHQPLPAVFPEVCDQPAPGPMAQYLRGRRKVEEKR